jgi:hypothetical protein
MVNSTWTKGHIDHLLRPFGWRDDAPDEEEEQEEAKVVEESPTATLRRRGVQKYDKKIEPVERKNPKFRVTKTVYPPCDTNALSILPLELRENIILSVAQFRFVQPRSLLPRQRSHSPACFADRRKNIASSCKLCAFSLTPSLSSERVRTEYVSSSREACGTKATSNASRGYERWGAS